MICRRVVWVLEQRCVGPLDEYAPDVRAWCS
jgi:hypothetical protein